MKVILNRDLSNLGDEGTIQTVRDGYARNYLLPRGFASLVNAHSLEIVKQKRIKIEAKKEKKKQMALSVKEKLEQTLLHFYVPVNDAGRLFGSVTALDISRELGKIDLSVERRKIEISGKAFRQIGLHKAKISLHDNIISFVKLQIHPVNEDGQVIDAETDLEESQENTESSEEKIE